MEIKLVVFDMVGTTVRDFDNVHESIQDALSNHDIFVTRDEVNKVMGLPKPIAIETLLKNELPPEEVHEEIIKTIYEEFVNIMVDFYQNDPMVKENEGCEMVLKLLKENGVKVAIDTGFSRVIADTIINRLGWEDKELIDFSITSDEVENGRPHPDMILAAMQQLGIQNIEQVAKVGDTISDLEEGSSAGCKYVVGITTGAFSREELQEAPHTHLIEKLEQLPEIIGIKA